MDLIEKFFIRLGEEKVLAKIFWVISLIASQLLFLVLISYVGNENHILGEVGYHISLFFITNLFGISAFAFPLSWFYLSFQVLKNEKNISEIIRHLFWFMGAMFWFNVLLLNTIFINTAWAGLLPKLFHAIFSRGFGGYSEFNVLVTGVEAFIFSTMVFFLVRSYYNIPLTTILLKVKTQLGKIYSFFSKAKSAINNQKKKLDGDTKTIHPDTPNGVKRKKELRSFLLNPIQKIKVIFQADWLGFINPVNEQELYKYFGDKAPQLSTRGFSVVKIDSGYFNNHNQNLQCPQNSYSENSVPEHTPSSEAESNTSEFVIDSDEVATEASEELIPFSAISGINRNSDKLFTDNPGVERTSSESRSDEIIDLSLGEFFSGINGNSEEVFSDKTSTESENTNHASSIINTSEVIVNAAKGEGVELTIVETNPSATILDSDSKPEEPTLIEVVPSVINKKTVKSNPSQGDKESCLADSQRLIFSKNPTRSKTLDIEIQNTAEKLEKTIQEFGIITKVVNISQGPVITQFELTLEPGVHINKIVSLSDNIALSLAAESIRIVAPIPGKAVIGVEIPNKQREMVTLRDITAKDVFENSKANLPIALGASISGEPLITDLASTPHLLVAGATGSGKSVCVNSIICSLLLKCSPEQVRFIMIDPKMVELNIYNGIPHLLSPVITDSSKAALTLKWAIAEMEARYRLLERFGVRSISSYNRMVRKSKDKKFEYGTLPYIVIIIDEFADLMMVAKKEVEDSVSRLAAMSRAIGIHLLLATQRPSVDVITGVIKANFPSRIAFQVSSKIDSRTIIDSMGAEKLLGKGDMLFQNVASGNPHRIQGTFLSDEEVREVVSDLKSKRESDYILTLNDEINSSNENNPELQDEVFQAALEVVKKEGKVSTSFLQRRLRIGYNRAARIVDMMEDMGIVGASDGVKPREVLVSNF